MGFFSFVCAQISPTRAQAPTPSALDPEGAHSSLLTQGLRTPGPRPARLCTHSSLGVLLPVRTRRGPSSPRRSASGRSGGRTIPRAHGRLWVSGPGRPPRASLAPGSASGVGRHRAGFARSILGPSPCGVRWDPPCGLRRPPGASSSGRSLRGEQDHTEVRRTEPRVDAEPGPATARVPSRSPLAPSEAASHVWDVVWKDDAGPGLRTPGSGPGSASDCRSRPFAAPPRPRRRDARAG